MSDQTVQDPIAAVDAPKADVPAANNAAPAADWLLSLPDDLKPVAEGKHWKSPADAVKAYAEAQKTFGERIAPPKADAPKAEWDAFYGKLGRPETPDGYAIGEMLPADAKVDPEFAKTAAGWFHEAGLLRPQVAHVVAKWNATADALEKAQAEEVKADFEKGTAQIKAEWGDAFAERNADVDRVASVAEWTTEELAAIRSVLGTARTMKSLAAIGAKFGKETAAFVDGKAAPQKTGIEAVFFPNGVGKPSNAKAFAN